MANLTIVQKVIGLGDDVAKIVHAGSEVEQIAAAVRVAVTDSLPLLVGGEHAGQYGNVQVLYEVGIDSLSPLDDPGFWALIVCVHELPDEVAARYTVTGAPAAAFVAAVCQAISDTVTNMPGRDAFFGSIGFTDPSTQIGIAVSWTLFA